jgi:predicted phosphodiesterase
VDDQLLFNPGSPTERRRQPHHTYGVLDLRDGVIHTATIEEIR